MLAKDYQAHVELEQTRENMPSYERIRRAYELAMARKAFEQRKQTRKW